LYSGYTIAFAIHPIYATILSLPATYATAFGFIYSYGRLIEAMANSKLLPKVCKLTTDSSGTPYVAMIAGSIVGYGICLLCYFVPSITIHLFDICILSAFMTYSSQSISYIYMKIHYSSIERAFKSPLGIYGAVFALVVWVLGAISVVVFANDDYFAVKVFSSLCAILGLYYYFFVRATQTISDEERQILFVAHVINCKCRTLSVPI
jgi:L-asparagine transporter-like permease